MSESREEIRARFEGLREKHNANPNMPNREAMSLITEMRECADEMDNLKQAELEAATHRVAVAKVNTFLHANYPCGCGKDRDCEQETHEAAEVVRIVLDTYGIGPDHD